MAARRGDTPEMSLATARVIDIHAHAVIEETFGQAGAFGPELYDDAGVPVFRIGDYRLRGVRYRGSAFMDPDMRIAAMARISQQMVYPVAQLNAYNTPPSAPLSQQRCSRDRPWCSR